VKGDVKTVAPVYNKQFSLQPRSA